MDYMIFNVADENLTTTERAMNETSVRHLNGELPENNFPYVTPLISISCCFVLSVLFVASLYVWSTTKQQNRDHPSTVKKRCFSVFAVMLISPIFVYKFSSPTVLENTHFFELLGLRLEGLLPAICIPLLLTVLLFLGPLSVQMQSESFRELFDFEHWKDCLTNILWIRNHIVAPLSEEFVFRACMMPLILQSFTPVAAVFITPLFFGTAHVHHICERLKMGIDLRTAILISCFQLCYTTLFGFYSAYLFACTGHFIAPFLVHAFCNHMGLPDIQELWQQHLIKRMILIGCYIVGFVGWIALLPLATQPSLYSNTLFWNR